jgi:hypothetical protein
MAYVGFEIDDNLRYLRRVRLKVVLLSPILPIGEIHDHCPPAAILLFIDGFHDIEALAIEKIGVITEQAFKLGHHRVSWWNGLGLELLQSLLDLCGIHPHRTTPSIEFPFAVIKAEKARRVARPGDEGQLAGSTVCANAR